MIDQVSLICQERIHSLLLFSTYLKYNIFLLNQGEKDDKIIAVCADDPEYRHFTDISQLPPHRLLEIKRFFEDCILTRVQSLIGSNFFLVCPIGLTC